jgi:hypothetical protein
MGKVAAGSTPVDLPASVDLASIGQGTIDPATVSKAGISGDTTFWRAESASEVFLIATNAGVVASTSTAKSDFAGHGLTLRLDSEKPAQGVLAPTSVSPAALAAAGLSKAGTDFYVDGKVNARTVSVTGVGAQKQSLARTAEPTGIVLYGAPGN